MNKRLRGVLGTALTWGAGWTVIGLAVGALQAIGLRAAGITIPMETSRFLALVTLRWTVFGIVAGSLFALALWYAGRRMTSFRALSGRRAALWGLGAGATLPLGFSAFLVAGGNSVPMIALVPFVITAGLFGAATAGGSVALARRAPELSAGSDTRALTPPIG